jgi:ubiquinone/menaquinone biosynthesis C-methylase UbiE
MTDDMLARARENAAKRGATNVEFRKGLIESLPVESGTVDYVISNCVINLSPINLRCSGKLPGC